KFLHDARDRSGHQGRREARSPCLDQTGRKLARGTACPERRGKSSILQPLTAEKGQVNDIGPLFPGRGNRHSRAIGSERRGGVGWYGSDIQACQETRPYSVGSDGG